MVAARATSSSSSSSKGMKSGFLKNGKAAEKGRTAEVEGTNGVPGFGKPGAWSEGLVDAVTAIFERILDRKALMDLDRRLRYGSGAKLHDYKSCGEDAAAQSAQLPGAPEEEEETCDDSGCEYCFSADEPLKLDFSALGFRCADENCVEDHDSTSTPDITTAAKSYADKKSAAEGGASDGGSRFCIHRAKPDDMVFVML